MKVHVIGAGFVGLATARVLCDHGHDVVVWDTDENRIEELRRGNVPFREKGLHAKFLGFRHVRARLDEEGPERADVVLLCVPTPQAEDGSANLDAVFTAASWAFDVFELGAWIIIRSTCPPGTNAKVVQHVGYARVISNPEFMAEGTAVRDIREPHKIVAGMDCPEMQLEDYRHVVRELYGWVDREKFIFGSSATAELAKYACNTMLAARVALVNEIATLAEYVSADYHVIRDALAADPRIGSRFLDAGPGYGGSCFPKDVKALAHIAPALGVISAVPRSNAFSVEWPGHYLDDIEGKTVAVLGLSFKPGTSDTRESPSAALIEGLRARGCSVQTWDPYVQGTHEAPEKCIEGADAIILMHPVEYLPFSTILLWAKGTDRVLVDAWGVYWKSRRPVHTLPHYAGRGIGQT